MRPTTTIPALLGARVEVTRAPVMSLLRGTAEPHAHVSIDDGAEITSAMLPMKETADLIVALTVAATMAHYAAGRDPREWLQQVERRIAEVCRVEVEG